MRTILRSLLVCLLLTCFGVGKGQLWEPLGGGTNKTVRDIYSDSSSIFLAGNFYYAGDSLCNGVAIWDGTSFDDIGGGSIDLNCFPPGPCLPIISIVKYHGDLFVGGYLQAMGIDQTIAYLSHWDGSEWLPCGNPNSIANVDIANDQLFALGIYDSIGGKQVTSISMWNGSEWDGLQGFDQIQFYSPPWVSKVEYFNGSYYFIGNFDGPNGFNEIVQWDGVNWKALGTGVLGGMANLWDVKAYQGQLFVAGYFDSGAGNASDNLMAWDGTQWYDPFPAVDFQSTIRSLEVIDGELYICTYLAFMDDGADSHGPYGLFRYDGMTLCAFGGEEISIEDIAGLNGELYVAANYTIEGYVGTGWAGDTVKYVGHWLGGDSVDYCISQPVRVQDPNSSTNPTINLYPNPTNSAFTLTLPPNTTTCTLKIHDITGREVAASRTYRAGDPPVDVTHLSAGLYFVEVRVKDRVEVIKLVKQ